MTAAPGEDNRLATSGPPPGWHPDPWGMAPWRWWDGQQWTPVLYGPYGEAWPLAAPPPPPKGPGIKGAGIAALGGAIGTALSLVVGVAFLLATDGHVSLDDPWLLLAGQLALWIGFVGAVVVASRINGTRSLKTDYGLSWPRAQDLYLGIIGGLIGRIFPTLLAVLLFLASGKSSTTKARPPSILGTTPHGAAGWAIVVALSVVGAPVVEELLFRGLVQGAFTRRTGAVPAIFITALIFSVAHVLNEGPLAPLLIFPSGVVLGYLRYRTGRLAPGMVAHATFNAAVFLLLLIPAFR